jgi:thiosulfate/3-mercaptopyruvate sulfurtransferase
MKPITAEELSALIEQGHSPKLLDVRWQLGDSEGHQKYTQGHIPGAVYVDLDSELAAPASASGGRHPLPDVTDLQAAARSWGINSGDRVVAYDTGANVAAARAWWLLRWAGVTDVDLLDGGFQGWIAAGHEIEVGEQAPTPGNVDLSSGLMPVIDSVAALEMASRGELVDARTEERYLGIFEPVDPKAGHIPGAINAPTVDNIDADGHFLPDAELQEAFNGKGITNSTRVGVYCGSGVTAAHTIYALSLAGIPAALYPGSWSQWCNDPSLPLATGPEASTT